MKQVFLSFLFFGLFQIICQPAFADGPEGTFTATKKNSKNLAVLSMTSEQVAGLDVFHIKGTIAISKIGKAAATSLSFKLTPIGVNFDTETTAKYKVNGKSKTARMILRFDEASDKWEVILSSTEFGNFDFLAKRKNLSSEIIGSWIWEHNVFGPMKIARFQGEGIAGTFSGTKAKKNADLKGFLIGFYDGKKWTGNSTITQGEKSTLGTFEFAFAKAKGRLSGAIYTFVGPTKYTNYYNLNKD